MAIISDLRCDIFIIIFFIYQYIIQYLIISDVQNDVGTLMAIRRQRLRCLSVAIMLKLACHKIHSIRYGTSTLRQLQNVSRDKTYARHPDLV